MRLRLSMVIFTTSVQPKAKKDLILRLHNLLVTVTQYQVHVTSMISSRSRSQAIFSKNALKLARHTDRWFTVKDHLVFEILTTEIQCSSVSATEIAEN